MTPEHRTAWMTRVKMPTPVQWIMALQVNGLCCRQMTGMCGSGASECMVLAWLRRGPQRVCSR